MNTRSDWREQVRSRQHSGTGDVDDGGCFVEGTEVQLVDGATRRVEMLEAGAYLYSPSAQSQAVEILGVASLPRRQTIVLEMESGESIEVTARHPFFTTAEPKAVPAAQLVVGDNLMTSSRPLRIVNIHEGRERTVYQVLSEHAGVMLVGLSGVHTPIWKD